MLNAKDGLNLPAEEWRAMGRKNLLDRARIQPGSRIYNKDDRLPQFFEEPLPPHNAVWDFTGEEIDTFWKF